MNTRADRGQMTEPGEIIKPVGIDDRHCGRQPLVGLMVIDDDDVEAELLCLRQRLDAGGAAVDGDEQVCAAIGQRSMASALGP